jgi:hypothetical protein
MERGLDVLRDQEDATSRAFHLKKVWWRGRKVALLTAWCLGLGLGTAWCQGLGREPVGARESERGAEDCRASHGVSCAHSGSTGPRIAEPAVRGGGYGGRHLGAWAGIAGRRLRARCHGGRGGGGMRGHRGGGRSVARAEEAGAEARASRRRRRGHARVSRAEAEPCAERVCGRLHY